MCPGGLRANSSRGRLVCIFECSESRRSSRARDIGILLCSGSDRLRGRTFFFAPPRPPLAAPSHPSGVQLVACPPDSEKIREIAGVESATELRRRLRRGRSFDRAFAASRMPITRSRGNDRAKPLARPAVSYRREETLFPR